MSPWIIAFSRPVVLSYVKWSSAWCFMAMRCTTLNSKSSSCSCQCVKSHVKSGALRNTSWVCREQCGKYTDIIPRSIIKVALPLLKQFTFSFSFRMVSLPCLMNVAIIWLLHLRWLIDFIAEGIQLICCNSLHLRYRLVANVGEPTKTVPRILAFIASKAVVSSFVNFSKRCRDLYETSY